MFARGSGTRAILALVLAVPLFGLLIAVLEIVIHGPSVEVAAAVAAVTAAAFLVVLVGTMVATRHAAGDSPRSLGLYAPLVTVGVMMAADGYFGRGLPLVVTLAIAALAMLIAVAVIKVFSGPFERLVERRRTASRERT